MPGPSVQDNSPQEVRHVFGGSVRVAKGGPVDLRSHMCAVRVLAV